MCANSRRLARSDSQRNSHARPGDRLEHSWLERRYSTLRPKAAQARPPPFSIEHVAGVAGRLLMFSWDGYFFVEVIFRVSARYVGTNAHSNPNNAFPR